VARYRLSRLAEADLIEIGSYPLQTWGEEQAGRYINDLVHNSQTSTSPSYSIG
jgi:plasmid stabilization system protein ParE